MNAAAKLIAELRAGLEGVTPGPWSTRPTAEGMCDTFVTAPAENPLGYRVVAIVAPQKRDEDAAHIARCSPDNIRILLDRLAELEAALLSERTRATETAALIVETIEPFDLLDLDARMEIAASIRTEGTKP